MSYILDALKKSDQERQQEVAHLHLQSVPGTPPPSLKVTSVPRRSLWPWLLFSGLLICGSMLQWSGWNRQEPKERTSPSLMLAAPETGKTLSPVTLHPERLDDWYQQLPERDISLPTPGTPQTGEPDGPGEVEKETIDPAFSQGAAKITAPHSQKISAPIRIKRDRKKIAFSPRSEATVIAQPLPVSPGKTGSSLPYLQDLPPQVQAEIPKLQYAGHAYALVPSQRMIIINGTIMREGDRLDGVTRLTEITLEGVIIDRNGVRFQMKCN
ncbi:MAG: hypothetical protein ACD_75C01795G0003 [uncultured bacterium]|nr:MAG: hypothetical protein ACD_75C01795G0003 [uncultured bacterium]